MKKKETGGACLFFLHPCGKNAAPCRLGWPGANPAERIAAGSEEKARPAYEKAPRPFHRLRAFSELVPVVGLEPTRYRYQRILSPSRLPIPSHRHRMPVYYTRCKSEIQEGI